MTLYSFDVSPEPAVPLVTILLGANDRGPLENVDRTLDKKLPVVIMKGAGGVADLLTFALKDVVKRCWRIENCEYIFLMIIHVSYREKCEWRSAIWKQVVDLFGKDHKESYEFVKGTLECMEKYRDNVGFCVVTHSTIHSALWHMNVSRRTTRC